jgi:hypothetical protein
MLQRLTKTFWSFNAVHLIADSEQSIDVSAAERAIALLASTPTLDQVHVHGIASDQGYTALFSALRLLGPRLQRLEFSESELPSPSALGPLAELRTHLQTLAIQTRHSNPLCVEHVASIGQLTQLKKLRLSFRAVKGNLLQPLSLDPLSSLAALTTLELDYTGNRRGYRSRTPCNCKECIGLLCLGKVLQCNVMAASMLLTIAVPLRKAAEHLIQLLVSGNKTWLPYTYDFELF